MDAPRRTAFRRLLDWIDGRRALKAEVDRLQRKNMRLRYSLDFETDCRKAKERRVADLERCLGESEAERNILATALDVVREALKAHEDWQARQPERVVVDVDGCTFSERYGGP